ncbi:flagellar basal body P-ring formation chaperone FlgA [Neorhizobium turbinariae]
MMFRRMNMIGAGAARLLMAALVAAASFAPAAAQMRTAVVPTQTIYPGEEIMPGMVQEVEVTNPHLTGDYTTKTRQVVGMVAKRTLLPGRTVPVSALREAFAVTRGKAVRLMFTVGSMTISAQGAPLENAAVGDLIRVRNIDSGVTVSGTVMADGSVQVVAK